MITSEFRLEFDTSYDNITSGSAPGLDDYERSYFLSKAQDELVKSWYKDRFEQAEKFRRALGNLVSTFTSTSEAVSTDRLYPESKLFIIPVDVQYIVAEQITTATPLVIGVKPVTSDEVSVFVADPFRRPSTTKIEKFALRLDRANVGTDRVVELLLFDDNIASYKLRYLRKPLPIILSDLTLLGAGLSIEGLSNETQCKLDSSIHREIIDRAVELALEAFEQQRLQSKVQLNERLK